MSGVYCGGCGEGDLVPDPAGAGARPVVCDLCGWTADGDLLSRKTPAEEEPWTKRERKAAGRLFFLWVDFDPENEAAVDGLLDLLHLGGLSLNTPVLLELGEKPTPETLERLRALPSETRVRLVP